MKALRLGLVGAGAIVRDRHLPGFAEIQNLEIAAVANSSPESSSAFCEKYAPLAKPVADWRELVARDDLDAIWVGTTPYLHHPVTLAALAANKHVFCQARMAMDLRQALEMWEASLAKPDLVTMLCPPPFGLKEDRFVQRLLKKAVVGEVRQVRLRSLSGAYFDPASPAHWRQKVEISGKNVMTLGIFAEVLQRWFGDVAAVSSQGRVVHSDRGNYAVKIPDVLDVLAEFSSGVLSSWHFSGVHPGVPVNDLEVVGSNGTLHFDFGSGKAARTSRSGSSENLQPNAQELRPWQVEKDFFAAVRDPEQPRPRPDFRDGVAYMRVTDAVAQARKTGERIRLEIPN